MEMKTLLNKLSQTIQKYKFVILILVIGLVLMSIPEGNTQNIRNNTEQKTSASEQKTQETQETLLSEILSCINGAGEVRVMLTQARGEEVVFQTNEDISTGTDTTEKTVTTVTVTDSERNQSGIIRQINPPQFLGAIIVCDGADDPAIRLAIVDAVSKVTGLGANQISVLKMK